MRWGLAAAAIVALGGWALERARFGRTDEDAALRVQAELRGRFDTSAAALAALAARVSGERATIAAAARDTGAARRLFDTLNAALPDESDPTGISVYDRTSAPLAWAGRVSELATVRIEGPPALFVTAGVRGPRLVRTEPLGDPSQPATRLATIVVEQSLGSLEAQPGESDTFTLTTSVAPVSLRTRIGNTGDRPPFAFPIPSTAGGLLVEADVSPAQIDAARTAWRHAWWTALLSIVALTLLLSAAPLVGTRRRARAPGPCIAATAALVAVLVATRAVLWVAAGFAMPGHTPGSPVDLLLSALLGVAIVWLVNDGIERRRLARVRLRLPNEPMISSAVAYALGGAAVVGLLALYDRMLRAIVARSNVDVLQFSLHPLAASRIAGAFGLVLLHATMIWAAVALVRLPGLGWRMPRSRRGIVAAAWTGGALAAIALVRIGGSTPIAPLAVAVFGVAACAATIVALRARVRHASQAARFGALFAALLAPAVLMYPALLAHATAAKEALIADKFAPEAASQREDLQERLRVALEQIDAMPSLPELILGSIDSDVDTPSTDRAFLVWQNTDLATFRLTSAVELYGPGGSLVSRFALRLPEYMAPARPSSRCRWDLVEEPSPFGAVERHVLRASRSLCSGGRVLGSIVVRVMLDYQTLPFIVSQNPYSDGTREEGVTAESAAGREVEFVEYGWSRAPLYASGTSVWSLPDDAFARLVESRDPFWATLVREGQRYRVYFRSDAGAIYALGYPVITWFGQLINLAELVTLALALYALLLLAATIFNALTAQAPASGRALLREIRSSFYQKLLLAYVAGAVVPVVILAVATQRYVASQLRAGIEDAAAKTATVAQRLVEDYATLQQRGANTLRALDDQVMVLVGAAIDQDVNLFDGTRLQATSERDLYASRALSVRTPADIYERIVLDRLPTYVGVEQDGYLLAAAPVRAGEREGVVTVPLTSRQQEIEREIDDLNRRVLFGAVLFSLLGAAIGYWLAERIADPVNRLTRATRRIARGDLDARVAATSSDELRRLVDDFNQMAADLKRQRRELQRTQRLEAWADMARQVAHDIKNPLTPIQLSAEHARRVNADRGRPLSPVLDDCVAAILSQVKLLRQISAEFSSFASSPTPRPEPTDVPALVEEVVAPYRAGLAGRVALDVRADPVLPKALIDRTLFARALTNVVENALHAMPGGGTLSIAITRLASAIGVEVVDTGVGMDPQSVARIFEPYFSTKATGTGLGLTIAKRNVELNGGTISVSSERGVGTTVRMTMKEVDG